MKNYFKKFSVIFVMLLAVIGFGIIQNGSVANAATVGQQLMSPESGWKRYTYKYDGISYIGTGWTDKNNEGYEIYTQNAGDKIEISFYGTEFRYIATYHNSHNTDVKVSIDGEVSSATTTPASVGVKLTSSDESIATVDSTGKVTAVKEGQATITATMTDGSNLSSACTGNMDIV